MGKSAREIIEENSDFQQMDLPLDLGRGEKVLQRTRLIAESPKTAWYELYLIRIPHGFLIEKHSGISSSHSRQKETWFRRDLAAAENKFFGIIKDKLNPERKSPRKYRVVETMTSGVWGLRINGTGTESVIGVDAENGKNSTLRKTLTRYLSYQKMFNAMELLCKAQHKRSITP